MKENFLCVFLIGQNYIKVGFLQQFGNFNYTSVNSRINTSIYLMISFHKILQNLKKRMRILKISLNFLQKYLFFLSSIFEKKLTKSSFYLRCKMSSIKIKKRGGKRLFKNWKGAIFSELLSFLKDVSSKWL